MASWRWGSSNGGAVQGPMRDSGPGSSIGGGIGGPCRLGGRRSYRRPESASTPFKKLNHPQWRDLKVAHA
ncbi:unnamed protein product [Staurois parvus]|uniref:Uncharacterized protein n=1 Tax=Staurois parvus TaxID=386267 RepID=A0ABN9AF34_9NEOB|nr:unnamed protein product [Staurois parvus]